MGVDAFDDALSPEYRPFEVAIIFFMFFGDLEGNMYLGLAPGFTIIASGSHTLVLLRLDGLPTLVLPTLDGLRALVLGQITMVAVQSHLHRWVVLHWIVPTTLYQAGEVLELSVSLRGR